MNNRGLIESLLLIDNKDREIVPFNLNPVQEYYYKNRSKRDIILKARQHGISSLILADMFVEAITIPNTTCVVISHEQHATQRLLDKVHFFHSLLSEPKPQLGHASASEITFPDLHSTIYIGTARSMTFGRGDRIDFAHACLHPDTQILTSGGRLKAVKDVVCGDKTYSSKRGNLITVSKRHVSQCENGMLKLTVAGNFSTPLILTPDHQILERGWKKAEDARWIASPIRLITSKRKKIGLEQRGKSRWNKTVDRYIKYDYNFGWLVGLYLAEGSVTTTGVTFSLSPNEDVFAAGIEDFMGNYNISVSRRIMDTNGCINGRLIKGKVLCVDVYSSSMKKIFLKLVGQDKMIPDWFWDCGEDFINGVIDGYLAGDGHKGSKGRFADYITSVRPQLLFQLRELLLSARKQYMGINYSEKREGWTGYFPMKEWKNKFHKGNVKFRTIRGLPYVMVKIKKKEKFSYSGDMYDLQTRGTFKTACGIVHNSELGFYEDGERIINAVEEAVPLSGRLVIESTPNGEDNILYDIWQKAGEKRVRYKPFFLPWWHCRDYTLPRGSPDALEPDRGKLDYLADEQELVEKFGLTEGQIRWRRMKLGEKGGLFYQEYPEDEVSCFHQSGDPVFDPILLTQMAHNCYEGTRHPQGWLEWQQPQPGARYVIGADSSPGVPGGSYSAAVVMDEDFRVCATFHGRLEPYQFAAILKQLGNHYNQAEIAVERNFTGYAVLSNLTDYGNIYMQRDFTTGRITNTPGWWTNEATKQFMLTTLKDYLPVLKLYDINVVRQARGYRYVKLTPKPQTHDDLVIALMIACAIKKVLGGARGFVGAAESWDF